jgi:hypothetical protein
VWGCGWNRKGIRLEVVIRIRRENEKENGIMYYGSNER